MDYQNIKDRLYHGHRKIANNTHLILDADGVEGLEAIWMKLHGNIVAKFCPTYLQLFSAGWHTHTTFVDGIKLDYNGTPMR